MLYRNLVLAALVTCGAAVAQNVNMNFAYYDSAEIWLNGVRYQPLTYTVPDKTDQDSSVVIVPIEEGTNVLAIRVNNHGFTGGFCASLDLTEVGSNDTVRSDGTWKCTDSREGMDGAAVSATAYDASAWMAAGDWGPLSESDGSNSKFWFQRNGLEAQYLFYDQAHWIWHPPTTYMRRTFTPEHATGDLLIRGNGFTHKVYVNGILVDQTESPIVKYPDAYPSVGPRITRDVALNEGVENVIAIEATCVDSVRHAFVKAGIVVSGGAKAVETDSGWTHSWQAADGWNTAGFDDASWLPLEPFATGTIYDAVSDPLTQSSWIWPNDMWFRTTFQAPVVGTLRITRATLPKATAASPESFTLMGRRMPADNMRVLKTKTMVIQRTTVFGNERIEKVLRLGK